MRGVSAVTTLPDELQDFAGHILDVDSHEMMPAQVWVREIGPVADRLARHWLSNTAQLGHLNHPNKPGYEKDDAPIESNTIWLRKGPTAPGATDPTRRPEIMDLMGVKRQLMFPTGVALYGMALCSSGLDYGYAKDIVDNRKEYGSALCKAYNEWTLKATTDRVRGVAVLFENTVEKLLAMAQDLVRRGIRAVWMPSAMLPGGSSPAHSALDPLWKLMSDNGVAVCLHTGVEENIFMSREWSNAEAFEGYRLFDEFKLDPWSRVNSHILTQNFLATMVLGGVFERHPGLRFGVIECGAYWVGPLCETMDLWFDQDPGGSRFATTQTFFLPHHPSHYIKRNVRVTAFDFEPVDKYIRQYGLEDVLCFASDYPHVEGGKNPVGGWYAMLKPMGREIVEKFFVDNGQWLLPDSSGDPLRCGGVRDRAGAA
jgi:predicted TIM-barrel fold metal-dependent hydrolase